MVSGTMASITPEMPPSVNMVRKPSANSIGVSRCSTPRHSVASQEKILMPVGTAMIAVVTIIGTRIHSCIPLTNMVTGGDDLHIHANLFLTAEPAHFVIFDRLEQFSLQVERHFADFIHKQRTT